MRGIDTRLKFHAMYGKVSVCSKSSKHLSTVTFLPSSSLYKYVNYVSSYKVTDVYNVERLLYIIMFVQSFCAVFVDFLHPSQEL